MTASSLDDGGSLYQKIENLMSRRKRDTSFTESWTQSINDMPPAELDTFDWNDDLDQNDLSSMIRLG